MRIIGYLTSGYPSMKGFIEAASAYITGGCDMLEISLPLVNNREAPYLSDLMKTAISKYPEYDLHFEGIRTIATAYPHIQITLLLYEETVKTIGALKIAEFCKECGIYDINSADLCDNSLLSVFALYNINIAGLITYTHDEDMLRKAKETSGFIYCQAFPREGQVTGLGRDTPEALISYIRSHNIKNTTVFKYVGHAVIKPYAFYTAAAIDKQYSIAITLNPFS